MADVSMDYEEDEVVLMDLNEIDRTIPEEEPAKPREKKPVGRNAGKKQGGAKKPRQVARGKRVITSYSIHYTKLYEVSLSIKQRKNRVKLPRTKLSSGERKLPITLTRSRLSLIWDVVSRITTFPAPNMEFLWT